LRFVFGVAGISYHLVYVYSVRSGRGMVATI
jgi:hypothetical protein